jgi:hypothetical protein
VARLRLRLPGHDAPEPRREEAERDRHDPRVLEREQRALLPRTLGPIRISAIELTSPVARPAIAPAAVNLRQYRASRIAGRLAEAATANASATRNATLAFGPSSDRDRDRERADRERRDPRDRTSSPSRRSLPRCSTLIQKSCANDVDAEIVSPATTARIVANAIAATNAKNSSPPSALREQRRAHVRCRRSRRCVAPDDRRGAEAQERRHDVERADDRIAQTTETRARARRAPCRSARGCAAARGPKISAHAERDQVERPHGGA